MEGKTLGHYRILGRLGAGGMGEVFRAEDLNLRRIVALKLLPQALSKDDVARERLVREARSASRLNHPNVATVYDVGEHHGQIFMAMEFIEGRPLHQILREGPLDAEQVVRLGAQVAAGLGEAHAHGLVHRDIKPSNILMRADGTVKVVDFGVALRLRPETKETQEMTSTAAGRLTRTGHAAGTVSYMSPEQARDGNSDQRGDLFSLGVVLYEAATGVAPFRGQTPLAIAASIMHDDPAAPRELAPQLPQGLQEIILRCLAKEPEERPHSAEFVREALLLLSEGGATSSVRALLQTRRRNRGLMLGALGLLATAAAVLGVLLWQSRLSPVGEPVIEHVEARRMFERAQGYEQRGYTLAAQRMAEEKYRDALEREPGNPWIGAHLVHLLAWTQLQYPDERRTAEIRELSELYVRDSEILPALLARARILLLDGQPAEAAAVARAAKGVAPERHEPFVLLGKALLDLGETSEGLAELRRGIEVGQGHVWARSSLAHALMVRGELDEAATEYVKVLEYAPDFPNALNNLGGIYVSVGRFTESIRYLRRALELHLDDAAAGNLATAYFHLGRMGDAIEAYHQAVELAPHFSTHKRNLAEAYEHTGDAEQARLWYGRAAEDADRALRVDPRNTAFQVDRAFCLAKLGRIADARRSLDEPLRDKPDNPYLLQVAAQLEALAGERERAFRLVRRAVEAGYPADLFRTDPVFARHRDDPEFLELLVAPDPLR